MAVSPQEPCGSARLHSFVLSNATATDRRLGEPGPYGCVEVLEVSGLLCAGKNFSESLIGSSGTEEDADCAVEERYDACARFLSDLRHPNVVQFLGICFLEDPSGPSRAMLVTEQLQCCLDDLLESTRGTIPLTKKYSILQDVARGLAYLHGRSPAVVHKDLTAKNVLLNSAMVAKIGDVGNSYMLEDKPGQLAKVMAKDSDMKVYMPPEVFENPPKLGPEMDMFSFGHLTLFTIIQVFPGQLQSLPKDSHDEVVKRTKYIDAMKREIGDSHELVQLVVQCLDHASDGRPSASEVLQRIKSISSQVVDPYHNMPRLQLQQLVKEKEERERKLQEENARLEEEIRQLEEQLKPPQLQETEREQHHSGDSHRETAECDLSSWDIVEMSQLTLDSNKLHSASSNEPTSTQPLSEKLVSSQAPPKEPSSTETREVLSKVSEVPSKELASTMKHSKESTSTKAPFTETETSSQNSSPTETSSNDHMTSSQASSSKVLSKDPAVANSTSKVSETCPEDPRSTKVQPKKPASTGSTPEDPVSTAVQPKKPASTGSTPEGPVSTAVQPKKPASSKALAKELARSSRASSTKVLSKKPAAAFKVSETCPEGPVSIKAQPKKPASTKVPAKEQASTAKKGKLSHRTDKGSARSTLAHSKAPAPTKTPLGEPGTSSKGPSAPKTHPKEPDTPFKKTKAPFGGSSSEFSNPRGGLGSGYEGQAEGRHEGRYGGDQLGRKYGGHQVGGGYGGYQSEGRYGSGFGGSPYGGGRGGGSPYGGGREYVGEKSLSGGGRKPGSDELRQRKQVAIKSMEDSSTRSLHVLNDTLQTGYSIAGELDRQAEGLDRAERRLEEMQLDLDRSKGHKQTKPGRSKTFDEVSTRHVSSRPYETTPPPSLAGLPSTGSEVADKNLDEMSQALHKLKGVAVHIGEQLDQTTAQAGRIQQMSHQTDRKIRNNMRRFL